MSLSHGRARRWRRRVGSRRRENGRRVGWVEPRSGGIPIIFRTHLRRDGFPPACAGVNPCYDATAAFSFVPDSGISAAAFSPSCTLGTVAFTSVIGRPWVGAMVLTSSRVDQMVEPVAIDVHVGELGPEQREVRERRRHVRQVERHRLFGEQAAMAVLVIVAVGEAVAREQHALACVSKPHQVVRRSRITGSTAIKERPPRSISSPSLIHRMRWSYCGNAR